MIDDQCSTTMQIAVAIDSTCLSDFVVLNSGPYEENTRKACMDPMQCQISASQASPIHKQYTCYSLSNIDKLTVEDIVQIIHSAYSSSYL